MRGTGHNYNTFVRTQSIAVPGPPTACACPAPHRPWAEDKGSCSSAPPAQMLTPKLKVAMASVQTKQAYFKQKIRILLPTQLGSSSEALCGTPSALWSMGRKQRNKMQHVRV